MARASRSKTPEFDPSELDDLIMTPAVGSGVGSHLLSHEPEVKPTTVAMFDKTTVDDVSTTTVASHVTPREESGVFNNDREPTTVVMFDQTSVVDFESTTVPEMTTVVEPTTVVMSVPRSLWLS